jgi:NADPH:quinone reductase-like Zn-dependent oxidoreductase
MLVIGATGGVGSFLVQLAAEAGARVMATAEYEDTTYVRSLGAAVAVPYRGADPILAALARVPSGVDVAVDLVHTGPALRDTAMAVREGGVVISPHYGPPFFDGGVRAEYARLDPSNACLAEVVGRAADGQLSVEVGATYPFSDAPRALAELAGKHTRGKTVVTF